LKISEEPRFFGGWSLLSGAGAGSLGKDLVKGISYRFLRFFGNQLIFAIGF
jgi:hypothetical protein